MKKNKSYTRHRIHRNGSVLAAFLVIMVVMLLIGLSVIKISQGHAIQTVAHHNEQVAMLAAEAGYEKAIYWMSDNPDLLLDLDVSGTSGTITFPNSKADYEVNFYGFVGYRPVFEVTADGYCGINRRSVRVYVAQAVSGWEMGMCRVPSSGSTTTPVYFADGEIVDMPIHINSYAAPDDADRDIHITGSPVFVKSVSLEESRHSSGGSDKYGTVMSVFQSEISFDQPRSLISDEASVTKKIQWYKTEILNDQPELVFKPTANGSVSEAQPAVQLEFYVGTDGKGYVRITDDCTVRGYTSGSSTWDYKIRPGTNATQFDKYPIYGYHYIHNNAEQNGKRITKAIDSIQVVSHYGTTPAPPCGMIFVEGNVVIGSASEHITNPLISTLNTVQGKVSVIATGNIWIADSIMVSDKDDAGSTYPRSGNGMPSLDNPNALGLFSQGVIKVIDPGMVEDLGGPLGNNGSIVYEPVGIKDSGQADYSYHRHLPDPIVIEAAITIGGGGWGAEHVRRSVNGGRKENGGNQDNLVVRGTLTEVVRGVVGLIGSDGYVKQYYFDRRLYTGLIPGSVRLKGKFVTTPSGWSDFRVDNKP